MTCRECKFLDVPLTRHGTRFFKKRGDSVFAYPCTAPAPEIGNMPESLAVAFKERRLMPPDGGARCPVKQLWWREKPSKPKGNFCTALEPLR